MADDAQLDQWLREGAALWNRQEFFECHEALEKPWLATKHEKKSEPPKDIRRDFYHGIILYAAAYVHWQRGNPIGVERKLAQARRLLSIIPSPFCGVDVAGFRAAVENHLSRGARGARLEQSEVPPLVVDERDP